MTKDQEGRTKMYLVRFFDPNEYEFVLSLHTTLAEAEAAYAALLLKHDVNQTSERTYTFDLPPKEIWSQLFDENGEGVGLYEIKADGKPAKLINEILDASPDQQPGART
jgi:hypothetical protein